MGKKQPLTPEERQRKAEEKQREENEGFMKGRPSRAEVANYVNALLEEKYMPEIQRLIAQGQQSTLIGIMTIQAIVSKKNVCTGEEIQQVTQEFLQAQKEELERKIKEQTEEAKTELSEKLS